MVRAADAMPEQRLEAPCSRAQRRFWVLDQLNPGNASLNIAVRWRLEGDVPLAAVEHTFRLIIARHETLRTSFEQIDGNPVQIVASRVSFSVPLVDLTSLTEQQALAESVRIAKVEAGISFDLTVPPLIRVTLLRVRQDLSFLLVTVHHTVCDGWSIGILAREFGEISASIGAGRFAALPELPLSYGEFAAWQNEQLAGSEWQAAMNYWTSNLKGLGYFELPTDLPRPPFPTIKSDIQSVLLARPLTDDVQQLASQNGCTMFMTVLAALSSLLHRYTGDTDIAIGTQVAGRAEVELENLVGVFINTVILRCGLQEDPTFIQLMKSVSDTVVNAFEHQCVPLETLIEILKPKRELNRNPLFSVNFIYQRSFIENATYGQFKLIDVPSYTAGALYDLNFFMVERPEGWRISCEYKTDLFETSTITRCLENLQNVLEAVVIDCTRRISELPITGSAERNLPLVGFNRTEARVPSHLTRPEMFAAQAAKTPDATAVHAFGEIESRLARIWREVLQCGKISASANFFELGGHSLLATRLLVKIEAEFGRRLTLASMFKAPTIAEQAALLLRPDVREFDFRRVIKLQPNGSKPPIIAIHNTGIFFNLSKKFGPDQPFTCLQLFDPALLDEALPETVEEIAAGYVRLIQHVHPAGPYIFVGWCIAGTLAFEVARQLQESRGETAVLLMIDTWVPGYLKRMPAFRAWLADHSYRVKLIALDWQKMRSGSQSLAGFIMKRAIVQRVMGLVRRSFADGKSANPGSAPFLTDEAYDQRLQAHLEKVLRRYRPSPTQLKVAVYRSSLEPRGLFLDYDMGWSDLAKGGVDTTLIEGDHHTMFLSPGVDRMSEDIATRIKAHCAGPK